MDVFTRVSFVCFGAVVILLCIEKLKILSLKTHFLQGQNRLLLVNFLRIYRLLLCLFLLGYLKITVSLLLNIEQDYQSFVAALFFLGIVVILYGIHVQTKMVDGMGQTISVLLPMCAHCKRVHGPDSVSGNGSEWESLGAKRSFIIRYQILRAALYFAISSKKSLWAERKKLNRGAKLSMSSPRRMSSRQQAIALQITKATS